MGWQPILAVLGALAAIFAGVIYINSIVRGPTRPLKVTWGGWSLVGVLGLISSIQGGAGVGIIATLPFVVLVIITFILSLNPKYGKPGGRQVDYIFGVIAGIVLLTQILFKYSPVVGATVAVAADLVFLWPTLRESWSHPEYESIMPWIIGAEAEILGIITLGNFSYASAAYPVYVLFGNLAVISILVNRRAKETAAKA